MLEEEKLIEEKLNEESQTIGDTSSTTQSEPSCSHPAELKDDTEPLKQSMEQDQSQPESGNETLLQTVDHVGGDEEPLETATVAPQKPTDVDTEIEALPIFPPSESSTIPILHTVQAGQPDHDEILTRTAHFLARTTLHTGEQETHGIDDYPALKGEGAGNLDYLEDLCLSDESSSTLSE
ncbi:hypothetical protein BLNAU_14103 [Blattamonas nauphoetae]|uniref:Uncharacterized protein n=1 Tax=Blattamonas nauphoetae TaxID=2049346 RepID=A0ABQ9XHX0_9EUKA|nr:hypothetical protein BLNAU_14103 [Blattamonas nauphoetae]